MKRYKVQQPYKDINEYIIMQRYWFFWWESTGTIFTDLSDATQYCGFLNNYEWR